ncbi:hypothetical protein [Psychroflexus sp. ALD_RP9]|uniref:hypothetical protein n=1 Tax=Psychroflexus sp. ALD_RP9 TaxID=2777186 RepID=UPI001A8E93E0|nr:hypothetical protein [Psychroflexus sp. ALD_RP9]QSS98123.1 hypothetical protein IMZ30_05255 [Psychroflexus sp. ALD_RP9]
MKAVKDHVEHLSEDSQNYLKSLIAYYKLDAFKKLSKSLVASLNLLLIGGIGLLLFLFISIGLSFLIGESLGKVAYGFLIMGGFYVILFFLSLAFAKPFIERKVLTFLSQVINDSEAKAEDLTSNE